MTVHSSYVLLLLLLLYSFILFRSEYRQKLPSRRRVAPAAPTENEYSFMREEI